MAKLLVRILLQSTILGGYSLGNKTYAQILSWVSFVLLCIYSQTIIVTLPWAGSCQIPSLSLGRLSGSSEDTLWISFGFYSNTANFPHSSFLPFQKSLSSERDVCFSHCKKTELLFKGQNACSIQNYVSPPKSIS